MASPAVPAVPTQGLGDAEVGVAGEGLFAVPSAVGLVAEGGFGAAETAVRVRLLEEVADLAGQREGLSQQGAGLGGLTGGEEDRTEQVERFGPFLAGAGLVADGEGLFQAFACLPVARAREMELTEGVQGQDLGVAVAAGPEPGEHVPEPSLGPGLTVTALAHVGLCEVAESVGVDDLVTGVPADHPALMEVIGGLPVAALQQAQVAEVEQGGGVEGPLADKAGQVGGVAEMAGRLLITPGEYGDAPEAEQPDALVVLIAG